MTIFSPIVLLLVTMEWRLAVGTWRTAVMFAFTTMVLGVAASTELLSALGLLNETSVKYLWISAAFTLSCRMIWRRKQGAMPLPSVRSLNWWWACLVLIVPAGAAAVIWPPNNFDCMTYHLPRVFEWAQAGSIAHYPTSIARQLYQPPLFEYCLLHLHLLGASDRAFNLLSVFSLAACGLAASRIINLRFTQPWAGPFAFSMVVTLPSAYLMASNPKNDLLLSFWCLAALYWTLEFRTAGGVRAIAGALIAMLLAVLTKGTAFILLPPIAVILLSSPAASWRTLGWPNRLGRPLMAVCLALAVTVPHFARNAATFGSPLGPGPTADGSNPRYSNSSLGIGTVASNLVRNLAIEAQTPWTPVNAAMQRGVEFFHDRAGLDLNSPDTTWPGAIFDVKAPGRIHDDLNPNATATVLILAASLAAILLRGRDPDRRPMLLLAVVVVSFVLFCAILRWQPWHSRLHVPIYLIGLTLVAYVALQLPSRSMLVLLFLASGAVAIWSAYASESRPLNARIIERLGPDERLFRNRGYVLSDYQGAIEQIRKDEPETLGLVFGGNEWEYPVWHWLGSERAIKKIGHYGTIKETWVSADPNWRPDELLVATNARNRIPPTALKGYGIVYASAYYEVYRDSKARLSGPPARLSEAVTTVYVGPEWHGEERGFGHVWRWARGNAVLQLVNNCRTTVKVQLTAQLMSFGATRKIEVRANGKQVWTGQVPPKSRINLNLGPMEIGMSGIALAISSDVPGVLVGNGDSRVVAFAISDIHVSLEPLP